MNEIITNLNEITKVFEVWIAEQGNESPEERENNRKYEDPTWPQCAAEDFVRYLMKIRRDTDCK